MTDIIYPSHPSLTGAPKGFSSDQVQQLNNPVPQAYSQQPYPMPHLPQSFQPTARRDVDTPQNVMVEGQNEFTQIPAHEGKLLQNVMWANPSSDLGVNMTPQTSLNPVSNSSSISVANPSYPPMPSMQAAPNAVMGASYAPSVDADELGLDEDPPLDSKSLMSSVRKRLASKPKAEKPKTVIEKVNTDIVADPKKPRSARSVFLTGVLCGAVVAYVLSAAIGNLADTKEYATVAAPQAVSKPVAQTEKLNDDLTETSSVNAKLVSKEGKGLFLDKQLTPNQ